MKKSQKGFTIIEVALVLAIAALIFLTVFLAVPALQRNQRNDARQRDVASVVEAYTSYMSNHPTTNLARQSGATDNQLKDDSSGTLSGDSSKPLGKYIETLSSNIEQVVVKDGSGSCSMLTDGSLYNVKTNNPQGDKITVYVGCRCKGTQDVTRGTARSAAVVGATELARSQYEPYCSTAN